MWCCQGSNVDNKSSRSHSRTPSDAPFMATMASDVPLMGTVTLDEALVRATACYPATINPKPNKNPKLPSRAAVMGRRWYG